MEVGLEAGPCHLASCVAGVAATERVQVAGVRGSPSDVCHGGQDWSWGAQGGTRVSTFPSVTGSNFCRLSGRK